MNVELTSIFEKIKNLALVTSVVAVLSFSCKLFLSPTFSVGLIWIYIF